MQEIIGHSSNLRLIQSLLNKGIQSFLFVGPKGVGKKTIACSFAKKILCLEKKESSCTCKSCLQFEKRTSSDFQFLKVDGKYFKIEQIDELQQSIVSRPKISDHKIYIVCSAHLMTSSAANSLLKTLEEPVDYAILFLTSENLNQVLPTIQSRCAVVEFRPLSEPDVFKVLQNLEYKDNLELASRISFGSVRNALSCLTGNSLSIRDRALNFVQDIKSLKLYQVLELIDDSMDENFVNYLNLIFLDLFASKNNGNLKNIDKVDEINKIAQSFSDESLCRILDRISNFRYVIKYNINFKLQVTQLLLEIKFLCTKYLKDA